MTQLPPVRQRVTETHRAEYLRALTVTGSHPDACRVIGVSRRTMAAHIAAHPDFSEEVEDARQQFAASLLAEAKRRAVDGVEKNVYHAGQVVGTETRYSDRLLLAMLEKIGPDEFRAPDRVIHDHSGIVTVAHSIDSAILAAMNPASRIEARRVMLLQDVRDKPDSEKQSALLSLAQDASRDGIDLDVLAMARQLRIGKLADAVDAEFEEVNPDYDLESFKELC